MLALDLIEMILNILSILNGLNFKEISQYLGLLMVFLLKDYC